MKKTYNKPMIAFESFELSNSIAAGCEHLANHGDPNQCKYENNGWTIFINADIGCMEGSDLIADEEICYHGPTDTNNVFGS